jgi:transposase
MTAKKTAKTSPPPLTGRGKLDALGIDALVEKIIEGKLQREICRDIGVAISSMVDWIAEDDERARRVKEARRAAARTYEEQAEQVIRDAAVRFELAKAKELAHHYRWRASRMDPAYSEKVAIGAATDLPPLRSLSDADLDARIAAKMKELDGQSQ